MREGQPVDGHAPRALFLEKAARHKVPHRQLDAAANGSFITWLPVARLCGLDALENKVHNIGKRGARRQATEFA